MIDGPVATDGPDAIRVTGRRRITGLLYLATLANFTVAAMLLVAVQLIVTGPLGGSPAAVGVTMAWFGFTAILVRPLAGRGVDRHGRRWYLVGSFVVLAVSTFGFLLADGLWIVILLRSLQGASAGVFYTVGLTVGIDLAGPGKQAAAVSYFSVFLYGGLGVGPPLAEYVHGRVGLSGVWVVTGAIGVVGLLATLGIPETGTIRRTAVRQRLRLAHPAAVVPGIVLFAPSLGLAAINGYGALYGDVAGLGGGGAVYATFAVTMVTVRLLLADLPDRLGNVPTATAGLAVTAAAFVLLAWPLEPWSALGGAALFAVGYAFLFPALLVLTLQRVQETEHAEALASYTAFLDIALGGGGYLVGVLVTAGGFGVAFTVAAVATVVALGGLRCDVRRVARV